jgi:phytoene dehydrogenase-like protein
MSNQWDSVDVVVVGGGLSGLATAAYLGRAGLSVEVVEMASSLGGRAATALRDGFSLNRGPHALYRRSEGHAVLRELGVPTPGSVAPARGYALRGRALHQLPVSTLSLCTTSLFGWGAKVTIGRLLERVLRIDSTELSHVSIEEWMTRAGVQSQAREFLEAIVRLSTYVNAPESLSAETAIRQVQRALGGVLYIDGGWQTLVNGLAARATASGARLTPGSRVTALTRDAWGVTGIVTADGRAVHARNVVLATPPEQATALLAGAGVAVPASMRHVTKVRVATLDVALRSLPRSDRRFVLGVDRPLYLSVHSGVAKLAPEGGAVLHVAKYLPARESNPDADRTELEALLDTAQPGWRREVVHAQYLPRMTAAERLDRAEDGGESGRPGPTLAELPGVYLAGDWVKGGSFLADASLGSARAAAETIALGHERRRSVA